MILKLLFICAVILLNGCAATTTQDIPNLHTVSLGVFRGGQPDKKGWAFLRRLGVTNVIKLNTPGEGSDDPAVALGMTVHCHPISLAEMIVWVDKDKLNQAVREIRYGTFVHCSHGQDRTGVAIYLYRRQQGWSKDKALRELMNLGFHKELHGLWEIVENDR